MHIAEDLRKLITARPFVPFAIYMGDGNVLRVPTVDHIAVPPGGKRVFVFSDDGSYDVLSPVLIARLNVERGEPVSSADE